MQKITSQINRNALIIFLGIMTFIISQNVFAGNGPENRNWRASEELIQSGQLHAPSAILQVNFRYDAEATPSLNIAEAVIKQGYAPTYPPLDSGYSLLLKSAARRHPFKTNVPNPQCNF